ncbi:hypothetical protein [Rhodanobacter sp. UC4436_H3]
MKLTPAGSHTTQCCQRVAYARIVLDHHRRKNRPRSPGALTSAVDWLTSADSVEKLLFNEWTSEFSITTAVTIRFCTNLHIQLDRKRLSRPHFLASNELEFSKRVFQHYRPGADIELAGPLGFPFDAYSGLSDRQKRIPARGRYAARGGWCQSRTRSARIDALIPAFANSSWPERII